MVGGGGGGNEAEGRDEGSAGTFLCLKGLVSLSNHGPRIPSFPVEEISGHYEGVVCGRGCSRSTMGSDPD